ncbi:MAG: hypothetical protein ACFE9N_15205 [Promethearchaeota archaeon]
MVTEELLEKNTNEMAPMLFPTKSKSEVKKKGKLKRFFMNENVILVLYSLGASAIIITLMIIAGILGAKVPIGTWWF